MKLDPITAARQIAEASLREPLTDFDRTLRGCGCSEVAADAILDLLRRKGAG